MNKKIYSVITGTGNYIPPVNFKNENFLENRFYDKSGNKLEKSNQEIIEKFKEITTIAERRYISPDLVTSDIAFMAAEDALKSSNINREELDYIIVAHNFGDVKNGNNRSDIVPSLAARVKYKLGIENPGTVCYDIIFGCPGWLQGIIQADYYIRTGDAKKVMVIGSEVLSRVSDPHDIDSMIYADGAGATILEARESDEPIGIISHNTRSDTLVYSQMLHMDKSYNPETEKADDIYLKMNGRKLYQYALQNVPQAIKDCIDKSDVDIKDVKKVLIHQANGKMDDAILERLYKLYNIDEIPDEVMPMTIAWLGNSSVATLPTLYDLIKKEKLNSHKINPGETIVFASVGAGMNINALVYKA